MGQTLKRRLISTGGALKGILHEDDEPTESELLLAEEGGREDDEAVRIPFDWRIANKRYQKATSL
jgi:hypothetical protein